MKVTSYIIRLMLCVFLLILVVISYFHLYFFEKNKIKQELAQRKEEETRLYNNLKTTIDSSEIQAKSVSVYDATSNRKIYSKNDQEKMPLASLAKTMTAILALDNKKVDSITITKSARSQLGEYGLKENEVWIKNDLIKFSLVASSNDAAFALAESDQNFLNKMNQKAVALGLRTTSYLNPTGLDIDKDTPSAYGTAEEMNKLSMYALETYPDIFSATTSPMINLTSVSGFKHIVNNTNLSLAKIPNILFSKTGLTETAGGNLTIIFQDIDKHKIVVTLLGSTQNGRFSDIEKLVEILYNKHKYE